MLFSLDVIRARKGDCLMLHYGTEADKRLMLIDGGPKAVYERYLRPRIEQVKKVRGLSENEPLTVDVLMVSHVDDDHIQGILDLTSELIESLPCQTFAKVTEMWHNSFENIIGGSTQGLTARLNSHFCTASLSGELPDDATVEANDHPEVILWNLKALASIPQGARLRSDAKRLEIGLNALVDGELIVAKQKSEPITTDGLTITVVGPTRHEIEELHKKHQAWLKQLQEKRITPEEALAAYVDKSVPNLSSIVMLIEAGPKSTLEKRILLTGDARGDKILEGLELAKLLKPGGKINVDILKVPHHGSSNNAGPDFFERIIAKHYVFSGDGEHGNPERETLEMLWKARGDADYKVHLTYPVDEIDQERKADWVKEQNKEKKNKEKKEKKAKEKKEKNPKIKLRPNWSPAEHSLQALFEKNRDFKKKLCIVDPARPHLINLLDPLEL